ncbi:hypothetical protein T484DRAFT_1803819, partial [Baffinella frigidus]
RPAALPLGESDVAKLAARQKQIDIGRNTEGFRRLQAQGMGGREVQDAGTLELTLVCSKKRYDGYLRMWKRKLYAFAGLNKMDFTQPAVEAEAVKEPAPALAPVTEEVTEDAAAAPPADKPLSFAAAAAGAGADAAKTEVSRGRKQVKPTRAAAAATL